MGQNFLCCHCNLRRCGMKGFLQFWFLLLLSLPASALKNGDAKYVGGTVPTVTAGVVGRLDTTSATSLTFEHAGTKVEIPYASIESYDYTDDVARHLGALPAIAVGLTKPRQRRHFFWISYRATGGTVAEVAVFEVPKQLPLILQAILQIRAPGTCKSRYSSLDPYGVPLRRDQSSGAGGRAKVVFAQRE